MTWVPDDFRATLAASGLFDGPWYRRRYRRSAHAVGRGEAPIDHFLRVGLAAGLDPGPSFSASRYLFCNPDVASSGLHPVVHYLVSGRAEGRDAHPVPAEGPARRPRRRARRRPRVLVVGHAAAEQLFGAERSLLDVLDGFRAIGFEAVVAVPRSSNTGYLAELRARSAVVEQVRTVPGPRSTFAEQVDQYVRLLGRHRVDAVHVNTIVPLAALHAARACGVPGVVNVREIPVGDPDLCQMLGHSDPESVIDEVLAAADHLIAPSMVAAAHYPLPSGMHVMPCVVDVERFAALHDHPRDDGRPLRVGLVGTLSPKKGIDDLVAVARMWTALHGDDDSGVEFVAVGSSTPASEALRSSPDCPANLVWAGYRPDPVAAMAEVDVLLSLSNCIEAFGRTVLEASAAGRPVIAYRRGGPTEVVDDGVSGFLVHPGAIDEVVARIELLRSDPARCAAMGVAGRNLARARFSPAALTDALATAYSSVLPPRSTRRARRHDTLVPLRTVNRSEFPHPFYVGTRGRFAGSTTVRFVHDHLLVGASLIGQRLQLVRLSPDRTTASIVDETPTLVAAPDPAAPPVVGSIDLLDVEVDDTGTTRVVTSNCASRSVTLWTVVDPTSASDTNPPSLRFDRTVSAGGETPGYIHGVSFVTGRPDLVAAAITTGTPRVTFVSLDDRPPSGLRVPDDIVIDGWLPKAVGSFPGHVAVASGQFNVDQVTGQWNDARIDLVRMHADGSHEIVATLMLPGNTADSCTVVERSPSRYDVMVADQIHDAVAVASLRLHDDGRVQLRRAADLVGSNFPHDSAYSPDRRLLAFAEYGTDSIRLRPVRGRGRG